MIDIWRIIFLFSSQIYSQYYVYTLQIFYTIILQTFCCNTITLYVKGLNRPRYNGKQSKLLSWPFMKQTRGTLNCHEGPKNMQHKLKLWCVYWSMPAVLQAFSLQRLIVRLWKGLIHAERHTKLWGVLGGSGSFMTP